MGAGDQGTFAKVKLGATVLVTVVSMVLAIVSFAILYGYTQDLQTVSNQWKKLPIVEMAFVQTSAVASYQCPAGFGPMENLGVWPGAKAMCDYSTASGYSSSRSIIGRTCQSNETAVGCTSRLAVSPITLTNWRNYYICVRRGGIAPVDRPPVIKAVLPVNSCPSGYKLCGWNSTNTAPDPSGTVYATCQPNSLPTCPYNNIQLISTASSPPLPNSPTIQYSGYSTLPGSASLAFYYNIVGPGLPVVDLAMTGGQLPCQIGTPGTPGRTDQRPNTQATNIGCYIVDTRYSQWDAETEATLFTANGVPSYYITTCSGSSLCSSTINWYLSWRSEIYWANDCPQSRTSVINNVDAVVGVTKAQLAILIVTIIFGLGLGVFAPYKEYKKPELSTDPVFVAKLSKAKIAGKICKIIPAAVALVIAKKVDTFYQSISKYDCSDSLTNSTFTYLSKNLSSIVSLNGAFIALDVALISYTLYAWYKITQKSKGHKHQSSKEVELPSMFMNPPSAPADAPFHGGAPAPLHPAAAPASHVIFNIQAPSAPSAPAVYNVPQPEVAGYSQPVHPSLVAPAAQQQHHQHQPAVTSRDITGQPIHPSLMGQQQQQQQPATVQMVINPETGQPMSPLNY